MDISEAHGIVQGTLRRCEVMCHGEIEGPNGREEQLGYTHTETWYKTQRGPGMGIAGHSRAPGAVENRQGHHQGEQEAWLLVREAREEAEGATYTGAQQEADAPHPCER